MPRVPEPLAAEPRHGDEHVLERGADALDLRPGIPGAERGAQEAHGIAHGARQQHAQPISELRDASHLRHAGERAAHRLEFGVGDLDHGGIDVAGELLRLALRRDATAVEDGEPVTAFRLVHVMRGDEDRRSAGDERKQVFPEIAPALRVDRARRLVEKQEFRLVQRRGAEREPLALAARKGARALLRDGLEVVAPDPVGDSLTSRGAIEPVDAAHELEILEHGQVVPERESLRHVAELSTQDLGIARYGMSEHRHRAARRHQQPAEHADRRGLARTVRSQEAVDLGAWHVEVDARDCPLGAEAAREVARGDRDAHGLGRPSARITSTGMPVGSLAASGSVSTTSARNARRPRSRWFSA